MEDPNHDEIEPQNQAPNAAQTPPDLAETQVTPILPQRAEIYDPDATRPLSVGDLDPQPAAEAADHTGFAETTAYTVAPAALPPSRRRGRGLLFVFLALLLLLGVAGLSAARGYQAGIELRQSAAATQVFAALDQQFQLGVQDIADKNYFRARQRFEYIIQQNPSYPGVTDRLAEVLVELNTTATPTLAPTVTLTPTPDLRSQEEMFAQASQALASKDWTGAIDSLLNLRKADPTYRAVEIDGMLYLALRNRGQEKIGQQADLEGGMYDLALAERFGPLDAEAQGYQTWASIYITGASFWEINWEQVVYYFSQIAPQMPYLRDGSGWTAQDRYRRGLVGYGEQLAAGGDWCGAQAQYELALTLNPPVDEIDSLNAVWTEAANVCSGSAEPPAEDAADPQSTPKPTKPPKRD